MIPQTDPAQAEATLSVASVVLRVGIAFMLVAANGFFVAAEFALVSAQRNRIEAWANTGSRRARLAHAAIQRRDHYISGSQLGITLSSLGLGWVGQSTFAALIAGLFVTLPAPWDAVGTHVVAGIIAFALIAVMHIVLGELAPKSLALLFPEKTSLWTAGPLILFSRLFSPFIAFVNGAANLLLRGLGLRASSEKERVHRPEEIELLLTQSAEQGLLREEPVEMIRGVFHLSDTTVAEVMTPRTEVIAIPLETSVDAAADFILEQGHSRYPVYAETIDHIVGVVLARDVWRGQREGRQSLEELMREPLFVPDTNSVEQVLRAMQDGQSHIGIVIDEFGGTEGIVTIEDLVEEIVGEIEDELDEAMPEFEETPSGQVLIRGRLAISDLNDHYGLTLPDEDYTTVGGFVLGRLGRIARVGDEVAFRGGRLRVLGMKGRRVDRLALTLTPEPAEVIAEEP